MIKTLLATIGIVATFFGGQYAAETGMLGDTMNTWRFTSSLLQPVVSSWNVYAPANLRFDGEIQPDGSTCSNGQILKRTGANDWDCSSDSTGGVSSNSLDFDEWINGTSTLDANFLIASGGFTYSFGTTDLTINLARVGTPASSTLQGFFDIVPSPGRYSGGNITDAGSGAVSVTAGTGALRALDNDTSPQYFISWVASNSFTVPINSVRYIGVAYNSGSPKVTMRTTQNWNYDTDFPLGIVVREGTTTVFIHNAPWWTGDSIANITERFDSVGFVERDNRTGGLIISNTGTRNVSVTSGGLLSRLSEFTISAIDTSSGGTFTQYYRDGASGWTSSASTTKWDNTVYDDGDGTPATLTVLAYTSRWFYLMTDGTLAELYGQSQDLDLADIIAESPPASVPDRILYEGILIGRFIIRASGTTPATTQSAFGTAFTAATVTAHSGLSGLAWTSSGHTGTALYLSGFNTTGAASESLESKYGNLLEADTIVGNWVNTANTWVDNEVSDILTLSGGTIGANSISGTQTTTGTLTLGDGGDAIVIESSNWDVSSGGAFTGVTGITSTGVLNFSGGTEFTIPTANTIDSEGDVDITVASDSFSIYTTAERVKSLKTCFGVSYPTPTAKDHISIWNAFDPFTISEVYMIASGANAAGWQLRHSTTNASFTDLFSSNKSASGSSTIKYTSFNDSTLTDGERVDFVITSASAVIDNVYVRACGFYD